MYSPCVHVGFQLLPAAHCVQPESYYKMNYDFVCVRMDVECAYVFGWTLDDMILTPALLFVSWQ